MLIRVKRGGVFLVVVAWLLKNKSFELIGLSPCSAPSANVKRQEKAFTPVKHLYHLTHC